MMLISHARFILARLCEMEDPNEQSMDELFGQFQAALQEEAIETDPSLLSPTDWLDVEIFLQCL